MLTPEQLGVAARANAHYRRVMADWLDLLDAANVPDNHDAMLHAEAVALAVAHFQEAHPPLLVDGVLGPKTAAALRRETWISPTGSDAFIVGGKRVTVDGIRVVDWTEPGGLSFYATKRAFYTTRSAAPTLSVFHWSVTPTAHGAFNVLVARELSVQLILDDDGTFYQGLDLATASAWHAGIVNPWSFGVEIAGGLPPRAGDPGVPLDVRGDQTRFGCFTKAQIAAITKAWPALHAAMGVPLVLPKRSASEPSRADLVTRGTDHRIAANTYSGACGHYHVTTKKPDPGAQFWPPLREAGFGVA